MNNDVNITNSKNSIIGTVISTTKIHFDKPKDYNVIYNTSITDYLKEITDNGVLYTDRYGNKIIFEDYNM